MSKTSWAELPDDVRAMVRERVGRVDRVEPVGQGFSSPFAAVLDTARGRFFVKGVRRDHPLAWTQAREAAVNPYVVPVGPRLRWRVTADGWDLLGFAYVAGRGADYAPGSADLPLVVDAMTALGRITCPGVELEAAEERFGSRLDDPADAALLAGTALLHTDWFHTNVHIDDGDGGRDGGDGEGGRGDGRGARVHVVDWAWATRGAAWVDPACWVVWLGFAGHGPYEAEQWAAKVPAWSAASAHELDVAAVALRRYWRSTEEEHPNDWTRRLRGAADRWAADRLDGRRPPPAKRRAAALSPPKWLA
ncbi:aminoglycoside phosphotransferase [Streptomyces sp. PTD5-9]|uniref:aminoglycoside phosphotransferase n=1 Tax=Streptomyces sp. PTD5-9 TaxID=3120150 RepID=UPI00300A6919